MVTIFGFKLPKIVDKIAEIFKSKNINESGAKLGNSTFYLQEKNQRDVKKEVRFIDGDMNQFNKDFPKSDDYQFTKELGQQTNRINKPAPTSVETIPRTDKIMDNEEFDTSALTAEQQNLSELGILNPHEPNPDAKPLKSAFKSGKNLEQNKKSAKTKTRC